MRLKLLTAYLLLQCFALSPTSQAQDFGDLRDGVNAEVNLEKIQDLLVWAQNSKLELSKALQKLEKIPRSQRNQFLRQSIDSIITSSDDKTTELYMRSVLRRARNLTDLLSQSSESPEKQVVTYKLLKDSVEWAIKLYEPEEKLLKEIQGATVATSVKVYWANFGLEYSQFVFAKLDPVLDHNTKLQMAMYSLGLLFNDLDRDNTTRRITAPVILEIARFMEAHKTLPTEPKEQLKLYRQIKALVNSAQKEVQLLIKDYDFSQKMALIQREDLQLIAGNVHTCILIKGQLKCWGMNGNGQTNVPQNLTGIRQITLGGYHTCALADQGLKCWGNNSYGQTDVPQNLTNIRQIAAGYAHTCALADQGLKCWGYNNYGQTDVPQNLTNIRQIAAGEYHTCALADQGLKCWGYNRHGQTDVPQNLTNIRQIAASEYHTCALADQGLKCWGSNYFGQTNVPQNLTNIQQMAAGDRRTCALADQGLKCWGNNEKGQTDVPQNLTNILLIAAGERHTCALADQGLKCWGNNEKGQTIVPPEVQQMLKDVINY